MQMRENFGDFKQLPPVMDTALYNNVTSNDAVDRSLGKTIYDNHNRVYLLNQPVRQNPNGQLITRLQNLRDGTVDIGTL
jgi:hypothetical protein